MSIFKRNFLEKKIDLAEISGQALTGKQVYMKALAVKIAVSYISSALSKCEFKVYEPTQEGIRENKKSKLYYILNVNPNPNQNSSQFISEFVTDMLLEGESLVFRYGEYLFATQEYGKTEFPLSGDRYEEIKKDGILAHKNQYAQDVFVFRNENQTTKSYIDNMYSEYDKLISEAFESARRSYGSKYKLKMDRQKAGDATFNETYKEVIEKQLRTFLRSPSAVYPQYSGFDLTEMKNEEKGKVEDIIALRKEIFETVAQAFRIPVTMMYGNITNMNEIVKVFLSLCIDPIADMISEEITRKYFTYDEWAKGYSVRVDTSCVNHLDLLDVAEKADKAVSSGVANIDEVRERLNMDTLDTEFSTHHYMTKNYSGIENILNNEEGGKTGE